MSAYWIPRWWHQRRNSRPEKRVNQLDRWYPQARSSLESFLPQRAFPADHHRSARLAGLADARQPWSEGRAAHDLLVLPAGAHDARRVRPEPAGHRRSEQAVADGDARGRQEGERALRDGAVRSRARAGDAEVERQLQLEGRRFVAVVVDPHVASPIRPA